MSQNNRNGKKLLGIFNILFFFLILVSLIFSIVIVINNVDLLPGNPIESMLEQESTPDGFTDLLVLTATEAHPPESIEATIPPDDQLTIISPIEFSGYLSNPGIGWISPWGKEDAAGIPTTLAYSDRSEIRWNLLNPLEGIYKWDLLDHQLGEAVAMGKQFSFRVYTMAGEEFGGHAVPDWVLDKGAIILPSGEPDYSNCIYQEEWGKFVEALRSRYDGNPNIAFIDISGYGNFNEWSWRDDQTIWDEVWEKNYEVGEAGPETISNLDSQARRRLADMFLGGNFFGHVCRDANFISKNVDYEYSGFQETQLVMPYAGIIQSTQYVFSRREDVGFRHDCWGRESSEKILTTLGKELENIWPNAPVVFETCSENQFKLSSAYTLLEGAHGSIIHNVNLTNLEHEDILNIVQGIGYRYTISEIRHSSSVKPGGEFYVSMTWLNVGNAPSYPKMGQKFELHLYLINELTGHLLDFPIQEDISKWLPFNSENFPADFGYQISGWMSLPQELVPGRYRIQVSILDQNSGIPILLGIEGRTPTGYYDLSTVEVGHP